MDDDRLLTRVDRTPNSEDDTPHRPCAECRSQQQSAGETAGCGSRTIGYEAFERHATGCRRNKLALRWFDRRGQPQNLTYRQLHTLSVHFANVLRRFSLGRGEPVSVLTGRVPEFVVCALGALKNSSLFFPLPVHLEPAETIRRLAVSRATVLVTTEALFHRTIAPYRDSLPALKHIVLIGEDNRRTFEPGTDNYQRLMETSSPYLAPGAEPSNGSAQPHIDASELMSCDDQPATPEGETSWQELISPLLAGETILLDEKFLLDKKA